MKGRTYTVTAVEEFDFEPPEPPYIQIEGFEWDQGRRGKRIPLFFRQCDFTAALDVFSNIDNLVRVGPLDIVMRQLPKLTAEDWAAIDQWRHERRW
jgi:hypothetical protein